MPKLTEALAALNVVKEYNIENFNEPTIFDFSATTDLGNAKRFVQLHKLNIKYVSAWKCFMVWDKTRWRQKDERQIVPLVESMITSMRNEAITISGEERREKLLKHAVSSESENRIMACIRLAASQPEIQAEPDDFDQDKYLINFSNGTIDLKKPVHSILREFQREDMMTKISAVQYIPDAKATRWLSFLDEIFEHKQEMIKYVQTILGMCMTGDASQEQIFIFWGATGGNGKGTLVEAVAHILSEYHVPLPIESILSKNKNNIPNDIAMLKGARLCIVNEPEFGVRISESKIKQLTSKDSISARFLGKEFFRFKPTHHTIIQTNPKPNIRLDGGIERRLVLVPFNFKVKTPDINLDIKLRAEASGIVNWLIEGCQTWQREGLQKPQEVVEAIEDYKAEMDPLQEFFDNFTIKDSTAITPHNILFTLYKLWCEYNEVIPYGAKGFTQIIIGKGYKSKLAYDAQGIRCRAYYGIRGTLGTLGNIDVLLRYMQSDATKSEVLEHLDTWNTSKEVGAHIGTIHACTYPVPSVPSVPNQFTDSDKSNNIYYSSSVPRVPSVLNNNSIVIKIKELLDKINKPDSIKELENLEERILTELQVNNDYDNIDGDIIRKMLQDYFKARGWS